MGPSVVVIGKADQAAGLRKRLGTDESVALYSDCEALKAIEAVLTHPPRILALDRAFVVTARGAALIARLRAEPRLCSIDVRVLAEDETNMPIILSARPAGLGFEGAVLKMSHPLDYCGTRRAPRFAVGDAAHVSVNGERGRLVNLSATGVQLLVQMRLRPSEPLRLALTDEKADIRVRGIVAWSAAEPHGSKVEYRAGVEFVNPDSLRLEAFCMRQMAGHEAAGRH
jgi:hypothetical protein